MSSPSNGLMNAGLYHDTDRNLIICIEHGFALLSHSIIEHLRKRHLCKGQELRAVEEYIRTIQSTLATPSNIQQPDHHTPRIPWIAVTPGFACNVPGCSQNKDWLSENRRIVEKHLSREHEKPDRRYRQHKRHFEQFPDHIKTISFQSIFPRPYFFPFIILDPQDASACSIETAGSHSSTAERPRLDLLTDEYEASRAEELDRLKTIDPNTHKSQIPPWLQSTGIAQWLGGFDKERIARLHADIDDETTELIHRTVYGALSAASKHVCTGVRGSRLSRLSARYLNSFEPNRLQARPFRPVQEVTTLKRYARSWSLLIVCLIRMQSSQDQDIPEQPSRLQFLLSGEIRSLLHAIQQKAEQLNHGDLHDDGDETPNSSFELIIQQLSCSLVRSCYFENPFHSPVVQYCAFKTIHSDGSWLPAATFAPFLSSMIHCMQLWIVVHCTQCEPCEAATNALERIVEQECKQYLVNSSHSPIAELSFWRLLCWKASNDTVLHPATTINEELSAVSHLHLQLNFDAWRKGLHAIYDQASTILQHDLLLGLHAVPQYSSILLFDNIGNLAPGFSFLKDPRNDLGNTEVWLFQQLQASPQLSSRFFSMQRTASSQPDTTPETSELRSRINKAAFQAYLTVNRRFLSLVAVLIYMTAGLPPRREELVSITWRNWETARSLYISNNLVVIVTGYHKSQWRVGNRPVSRFLPYQVGNMLLQYLIYITPFLSFIRHILQLPPSQGFLFTDGGSDPWSADRISHCMQRQTTQYLGFSVTTRQWRHIAIAIDRRLLQSQGCRAYAIKESFGRRPLRDTEQSDSELDAEPFQDSTDNELHAVDFDERTSHLQASHTARTGNAVYGNDTSLLFGLTDFLLASFRRVSQRWHIFAGFDIAVDHMQISRPNDPVTTCNPAKPDTQGSTKAAIDAVQTENEQRTDSRQKKHTSRSHKRKATSSLTDIAYAQRLHAEELHTVKALELSSNIRPSDGSNLKTRAAMWTWPTIEKALQRLLGLHASFRSDIQRDAMRLIASTSPENLVIMPTGGGKTLLYILPTILPGAQVTIVITPLVALQQDLILRCTQWGINFGVYTARSALQPTAAQPSLLLVDAERASSPSFQTLLSELHAAGRLDRIVLDEAHLLLTASHYRQQLPALATLQQYHCPFVCLTATMPPTAERELRLTLCLTPQLERLRASSDRPNLQYRIQFIKQDQKRVHAGRYATKEDVLVDAVVRACLDMLQQHASDKTARILCYVRQKKIGSILKEELNCNFYHSSLEDRESNLTTWRLGTSSPIMIATTALGAGIDYPNVRGIIHVDAPAGLLDYAQETGRAGRDGLHAECLVLLTDGWIVSWDRGFRTDFLHEDDRQMTRFLESKPPLCLRMQLTKYLDGGEGTTCKPPTIDKTDRISSDTRCSHCMQASQIHAVNSSRGSLDYTESLSSYDDTEDSTKSETADNTFQKKEQPEYRINQSIYSTRETMVRLQNMDRSNGMQLYESRVGVWSAACIPCSFVRRKTVYGEHSDCMQDSAAVAHLRLNIQFAKYIGCWKCGQPLTICDPRRGNPCMRSTLIFDICWFALSKDTSASREILHAIGAPLREETSATAYRLEEDPSILRWLGKKSSLYAQEASNAARFAHYWLDRLQSLCT